MKIVGRDNLLSSGSLRSPSLLFGRSSRTLLRGAGNGGLEPPAPSVLEGVARTLGLHSRLGLLDLKEAALLLRVGCGRLRLGRRAHAMTSLCALWRRSFFRSLHRLRPTTWRASSSIRCCRWNRCPSPSSASIRPNETQWLR